MALALFPYGRTLFCISSNLSKELVTMKREIKIALSAAVVASVAAVGPAFCLNYTGATQYPDVATTLRVSRQSVIKVHTDHGVIALPGDPSPTWDEIEYAVFVADSIADFEFANSEIPWRISNE
jgi:hypothetical protein